VQFVSLAAVSANVRPRPSKSAVPGDPLVATARNPAFVTAKAIGCQRERDLPLKNGECSEMPFEMSVMP
jgi:hypothetical protein